MKAYVRVIWTCQKLFSWSTPIRINPNWTTRGANKALARVLLEQDVARQTCQREAVNAMFTVEKPYSE